MTDGLVADTLEMAVEAMAEEAAAQVESQVAGMEGAIQGDGMEEALDEWQRERPIAKYLQAEAALAAPAEVMDSAPHACARMHLPTCTHCTHHAPCVRAAGNGDAEQERRVQEGEPQGVRASQGECARTRPYAAL